MRAALLLEPRLSEDSVVALVLAQGLAEKLRSREALPGAEAVGKELAQAEALLAALALRLSVELLLPQPVALPAPAEALAAAVGEMGCVDVAQGVPLGEAQAL